MLDLYRGKLSWRRLAVLIRGLTQDPRSALFRSISVSVAPPAESDALDGMTAHQQMQALEWTVERELLLVVANEVRNVLSAVLNAQPELPPHPRPWETPEVDAEVNKARHDIYNSPAASAARQLVTGG